MVTRKRTRFLIFLSIGPLSVFSAFSAVSSAPPFYPDKTKLLEKSEECVHFLTGMRSGERRKQLAMRLRGMRWLADVKDVDCRAKGIAERHCILERLARTG